MWIGSDDALRARIVFDRLLILLFALVLSALILFSAFSSAYAATSPVGAIPAQFKVSESGAASYSVPIDVPPGTAGMQPSLSLQYSSQGGNGLLGMGWSLGGASGITRCARTQAQDGVIGGVSFDSNDRFCMDGQRLIAINGIDGADGTEYRTERESYSRIISYGVAGSGPAYFQVWTKSGQIMEFGVTTDSRIEAQGKSSVLVWALDKVQDTSGNYFTISYAEDNANGQYYPTRMNYTGNANNIRAKVVPYNSVQFIYETRTDATAQYVAGSVIKSTVRLKNVQTFVGTALVKDYRITYGISASTGYSEILSVNVCAGDGVCLPATSFNWSTVPAALQAQRWETNGGAYSSSTQRWFTSDANGDGRADLINVFNDGGLMSADVHISTGSGFQIQRWETKAGGYWDTQRWFTDDANGDGRADLINVFNDSGLMSTDVHINTGSGFQIQRWETQAGGYSDTQQWFTADVNGDGRADLINVFNDNGFMSVDVHINTGSGFQIQRWETQAGAYSDAQHWYVADANGDGRADLINVFNDSISQYVDVHINTGTGFQIQHWDNEYAQGINSSIVTWLLADVNGDRRMDLVNIYTIVNVATDTYQTTSYIDVYVNTGNAFKMQQWVLQADVNWSNFLWYAADVNGDGRADVIAIYNTLANDPYSGGFGPVVVDTFVSTGSGMNMQAWETGGTYWNGNQNWFVADANGDRRSDLVQVYNYYGAGSMYADVNLASSGSATSIPDLINTVTTGLGAISNLVYKPITDNTIYSKENNGTYPTVDVQAPIYVVAASSNSDGIGGNYQYTYHYGGMKADLTGRGLLGFRAMDTTDPQTGIVTHNEYLQNYPYTGMPSYSTKTVNGTLVNQAQNSYTTTALGGTRYAVLPGQSVESSYELNGNLVTTVTTNTLYDTYGNPTQIVTGTGDGYSKTTVNTYDNIIDASHWFLGRLTRSTVTSTTP